jgi:Asp-tRNA(Asn)/Glu-tRNA(Gln) amidotransferase A subunit family amidase
MTSPHRMRGGERPAFTLGLCEAARKIALGELTSEALTQACVERIEALERTVRAWEWFDGERALRLARAADRARLARQGHGSDDHEDALPVAERGSLAGIPIGVKDLIDTAGIPTRMGSSIYADHIPGRDADLVRRLCAAGAFVMGKTVTTEFAFMVPNKTRNPWNPAHTPGGSSSGSAAAVACGMVPGAIGTQTNGSVIRPAAFCGVVGFKPGVGRMSTGGVLPFSRTLDQPGVFARSVADAALLASRLTLRDGVIGHRVEALRSVPSLIAVRSPVWDKAEPAQQARFLEDVELLRAAGARILARELPAEFDAAHRTHRTIMLYEAARAARQVRRRFRAHISDHLNRALDEGECIRGSDYRAALRTRTVLQAQLAAFLDGGQGAILTPPAPGEAPGRLDTTGDPVFNSLWTLCGVPCITIPTGLGPRGLPLGLQIVAREGECNYLLAVAAWCEGRVGFRDLLEREGSGSEAVAGALPATRASTSRQSD